MNNFNNVFLTIKRFAGDKGIVDGPEVFEKIAKDAKVPHAKIDFILKTLQDLQLIRYSNEEHYVKLTAFGRKQERLFTDT